MVAAHISICPAARNICHGVVINWFYRYQYKTHGKSLQIASNLGCALENKGRALFSLVNIVLENKI